MKMIGANDIIAALGVSQNTAYKIIRDLNNELKKSGCRTIQSRVNEEYFRQAYFATPSKKEGENDGRA